MRKNKKKIVIIGPVTSNGGISQVINAITEQECLLDSYEIIKINSSQYKDTGLIGELITFINGIAIYFFTLLFKNPEIIHIHTSANISFYRKCIFGVIGFLFNKKVVFHIHSSNFYHFFCNPSKKVLEKLIYAIFKRADKIICLCNDWKIALVNKYHLDNCIVVTNPVKKINPTYEIKKTNSIKTLLFMGFFIESKGIKDLLETFKKICENNDKIMLILCGKGELNGYINEFIKLNQLTKKIINAGWVSGKKKEYFLQHADLFILPSYKEGVPIAILEAFSYGLPVISTRISGIPEMINDKQNGFIIEPGDRKELKKKIEEIINNSELSKEMKYNNIEKVKLHQPEIIANKWKDLYTELSNA